MGGYSGNKCFLYSLPTVTMSFHHSKLDIPIALVGGFFASFLTLAFSVYQQSSTTFLGQLLAGDPVDNQQFPTTLGSMQAAIGGDDPLLNAMGSYGWWVAVMIGGLIAAAVLLKLMRRYV